MGWRNSPHVFTLCCFYELSLTWADNHMTCYEVFDMQKTQRQCGCCNDTIVRIYMSGHLTGHICPGMKNDCFSRVHTAAIHAAHILRGPIFGLAPAPAWAGGFCA
jgi:hypothetical protein